MAREWQISVRFFFLFFFFHFSRLIFVNFRNRPDIRGPTGSDIQKQVIDETRRGVIEVADPAGSNAPIWSIIFHHFIVRKQFWPYIFFSLLFINQLLCKKHWITTK